jgi:D-alanyl-D-alanine carboxypeptidase
MDVRMGEARRLFLLTFAAVFTAACSSSPTEKLTASLNSEARKLVHDYDLPGITVAMAGPDGVISIAIGHADREGERAMSPETPMLAASIGKTFVAATVLQLVDEGRLDLDDPISTWLGRRMWFADLPNADTIRVRHLLQHTSGLPDHVHMDAFAQLGLDRAAELGPEGMVALVQGTEPLFPAGAGWSYTDTGYLLLGFIIEAETGRSYYDEIRARFLEPLALLSTGPSDRKALPGLARGYVSAASGLGLPPVTTDDAGIMLWDPGIEWTGGGCYSTSHDIAIWGRAFLSGRLLEPDTYTQLLDGVAASGDDAMSLYGLGIAILRQSRWGPLYGHRGWIPGYVSSLQYYPDYDTALAFQTNTDREITDAEEPVIRRFEERLAAAIFGETL